MPIYEYSCLKCAVEIEKVQSIGGDAPHCPKCDAKMRKQLTFPGMVKITGDGGYPSRRKFVNGTAPYTTRQVKPWLDSDPSNPNWLSQDANRREEERLEERLAVKSRD